MEIVTLIDQLGGGIGAVALAVVGYAYWKTRQALDALQDKRADELREMVKATMTAQHSTADALKGVTEAIDRLAQKVISEGL